MPKEFKKATKCGYCKKKLSAKRLREKARYCDKTCYAQVRKQNTLDKRGVACPVCHGWFKPRHPERGGTHYCSRECFLKSRRKHAPEPCPVCGETFLRTHRRQKTCSGECGHVLTGRAHAVLKRGAGNPMKRAEVREKVSKTLRRMKHKPPIQGGNGRPLPEPQQRVLELFPGTVAEHPITTRLKKSDGQRMVYKVDVAFCALKVAVEIDGRSHNTTTRKAQDKKKDKALRVVGWSVLRLSNQQAMSDEAVTIIEAFTRLQSETGKAILQKAY